jgi:ADP-dependent NAD(P)H-hydrate dehydratase
VADEPRPLDSALLRDRPLPFPEHEADKNSRGRVLAIGGSRRVPGGIQLTVEAALRAGAGKIQVATVESAAMALGIAMPEVAVFGLPENEMGEIQAADALPSTLPLAGCDALVAGPAMYDRQSASAVVGGLLANCEAQMVLDAAVLMALGDHVDGLRALEHMPVLTPHLGELAAMEQREAADIEEDRVGAVRQASERFASVCVLKGSISLIAEPGGEVFAYAGGGVGLATGGSGDVLAGIVAGLCARGVEPLDATLWAVWLHGEAGRRCAEQIGPIGFLARELLAHVPGLIRAASAT